MNMPLLAMAGGAMVDLGTWGWTLSEATAVNNAGQVVGWANNADGPCDAPSSGADGGRTWR